MARVFAADWNFLRSMDAARRDARLAVRLLLKTPVFTATAAITLAPGIGANTAVFTLMKLIVMDALPVSRPERLVVLHDSGPPFSGYGARIGNPMSSAFSYPLYQDLNSATANVFSGVLARSQGRFEGASSEFGSR